MTSDQARDFVARLSALAEVFDVKLSAPRSLLYVEALRDLPVDALLAALNTAARTCTFFPKPAELRTLALGASGGTRRYLGYDGWRDDCVRRHDGTCPHFPAHQLRLAKEAAA